MNKGWREKTELRMLRFKMSVYRETPAPSLVGPLLTPYSRLRSCRYLGRSPCREAARLQGNRESRLSPVPNPVDLCRRESTGSAPARKRVPASGLFDGRRSIAVLLSTPHFFDKQENAS